MKSELYFWFIGTENNFFFFEGGGGVISFSNNASIKWSLPNHVPTINVFHVTTLIIIQIVYIFSAYMTEHIKTMYNLQRHLFTF